MSVKGALAIALVAATLLAAACPALAIGGPSQGPPGPRVKVILTSADLRQALTRMPDLSFAATSTHSAPVIRVNDQIRLQRVSGFGGGMSDSSAWLLRYGLAPSTQAWIIGKLFSTRGIDLNFLRLPLGASDFTADGHPYSYDDLPPGQSDPALAHFTIAHDLAYIVPMLAKAMAVNPHLEILGSVWSDPPWMKANDAFDNLGNRGTLLASAYGPLASYFVKVLEAYAAAGVPISAITPQNEPHATSPYPGGELPEPDEADWITNALDPALVAAGLHPKIYGYDGGYFLGYPEALLAGPAGGSLSGVAWHCYGGANAMSALHEAYPGKEEIVSECSPGIVPYPVTEILISSVRNWASAVGLWNLALDPAGGPVQPPNYGCFGCTGLVTIDPRQHSIALGLDYYQLGQISKYVQPGAVRIGSPRGVRDFRTASGLYGVTAGLDNVALVNPDGSKVLVTYDNSPRPVRFAVRWRGRAFAYTLASGATATFTWR